MNLLDEIILKNDEGVDYYDIRNSKNKRWVLEVDNLKNGFKLYQPTALKGILLKRFFPFIHSCKYLRKKLKIKKEKFIVSSKVKSILDKLFSKEYHVSFFGGTPSAHQKAVLQISLNDEILAYCKIADNKVVEKLFDSECDTLKYLESRNIKNVPKVIARENIDDIYLFCQTNVKTKKSRTIKKIKKYHIDFLEDMYKKTNVTLLFENSDYYKMLQDLKNKNNFNNVSDKELIRCIIEKIENIYNGKMVNFAFYHGDFTPWNIAIDNNCVKLFDFEYAKKTYPYYLDIFHFFLQTELFVKKNNEERILYDLEKLKKKIKHITIDVDMYFIMYLLEVINLYLSRNDNEIQEEKENYKIRMNLLRKMVKKK